MQKETIGIVGIVLAVALVGLFSETNNPEGMAARKIIVHHGMSYDDVTREAGGPVSPEVLAQYGIKIIDENRIATPGRKPVPIQMQMQDKHQSKNEMRKYKSNKMMVRV